MAQDACGFGMPTTSMRHIRQLPAIDSRSWKQKRGISAPAASHACNSVYSAGTSISLPSTMSLVIAVSSLSQLAVRRRDAGGFQGCLHPILGDGRICCEIAGLGLVFLAKKRQMRLQVVVAGGKPLAAVGKGGPRFLAGIEKIRDKALVLSAEIAATRLDRIVIGRGKFRIFERQIGVAQISLPRAGCATAGAKLVDLEQDRYKAEQRHASLRHLRQRPVFLPEWCGLRHQSYSAATICAGSRMP